MLDEVLCTGAHVGAFGVVADLSACAKCQTLIEIYNKEEINDSVEIEGEQFEHWFPECNQGKKILKL